ncbi:MAG: ABC transporter ATP-binding protein [Bdellovibrionaceae bacterium]|nr:ABC transporter ATP-binding protein [Pseudobdellovibrionaceae bacterium]
MEIYKVSGLHKKYRKMQVLEDLSTSFRSGEFVALLGANGSGKSTFLRLLAQEEQPTEGSIFYHKQDLHDITVNCREDVLFINENHSLPFGISLEQWAKIFSEQYVRYDKPLFYDLLKRFDVDKGRNFSSLSRGQKMKALFALQAPKKPSVYLIDEITSVLDVGSRLELMTFLKKEVAGGALVVMTTNIGTELQTIATDVCYLRQGKMVLNCKKSDIKNRFIKYRAVEPQMEKDLLASPAKLIHINSDGSKSFLIATDVDVKLPNVLVDKREVSVEDVAAFYTLQELSSGYI